MLYSVSTLLERLKMFVIDADLRRWRDSRIYDSMEQRHWPATINSSVGRAATAAWRDIDLDTSFYQSSIHAFSGTTVS